MASLKDLASRVRETLFKTQPVQNLKAWGQVATQPKMRQQYMSQVVKPAIQPKPQKMLSPLPSTSTPDPFQKMYDAGWREVGAPTPTPAKAQMPTPTPTPIPSTIREIAYEKRPYNKEIVDVWGKNANIAHDILRYVEEETEKVSGENVSYQTGPQVDVANRINPETGKWDPNAPIKVFTNPFTGQEEQSIDRGLFRINNETFYDFQRRFPELLEKQGIAKWDDILNTKKNIIMAWIIFNKQQEAWYAAKQTTGARIE